MGINHWGLSFNENKKEKYVKAEFGDTAAVILGASGEEMMILKNFILQALFLSMRKDRDTSAVILAGGREWRGISDVGWFLQALFCLKKILFILFVCFVFKLPC